MSDGGARGREVDVVAGVLRLSGKERRGLHVAEYDHRQCYQECAQTVRWRGVSVERRRP